MRASLVVLGLFVAAIAVALVVYVPWRQAPLGASDFADFLPGLLEHDTFGSRLAALVRFYREQGRVNLVLYAYIVAEWTAFGARAAAWHISRFLEMCGIVGGAYILIRRITGSRSAALAGASLYFVAPSAFAAFTRPTVAEPLAMWPILGAALLATRHQRTPHWRRSAVLIAVMCGVVILTKEVLVVVVPFVVLLAATFQEPATFVRPTATRRNVWLVSLTVAVCAVAMIPVAVGAWHAAPTAYSARYGQHHPSLSYFGALAMALTLPGFEAYAPRHGYAVTANLLFLAVVAAGWMAGLRDRETRRARLLLAVALAAVPCAGAVIYSPWPFYSFFYGLPFLLASATLLAFAIAFLERERHAWRWPAYVACAALVVQSGTFAAHAARSALAWRRANAQVADLIARQSASDRILVATRKVNPLAWAGRGAALRRFAAALHGGHEMPRVEDVLCATIDSSAARPARDTLTVISYADDCGTLDHPAWSTTERYSYVTAWTFATEEDSVRVDARTSAALQ